MFHGWALALKNIFLPLFCKQCGSRLLTEENGFFCPTCWELSPRVERPFCVVCGRPHPGAVGLGTRSNFACAECRDRKQRPYGRIYGAAVYDGTVADAIKLLKFLDRERLARPLGDLMGEFARRELDCEAYDYLVPVPLHRVRERERGFNQSRLLATELLPVFPNARLDESLWRIRPTRVQSRASSSQERRANVVGAFAVRGDRLTGGRVLLVDDVVTTGETISECASALKRAGVAQVDVLATALAIPGGGVVR
ncbi:MAG: ComF family protein [Nitrospiraceae bacterium]|nr:ComF family protein [Nitrospiraceae bacterium]